MKRVEVRKMDKGTRESMRELLSAGVISLAVGIAVGWFGAGLFRGDREADPERTESAGDVTPPLPSDDDTSADGMIESWMDTLAGMGMRIVPESLFEDFTVYPLDRFGRVNEDARELFLFTDQEVERLNGIIRDVEDMLMEAEVGRLEVIHASETEIVFLIPAFPEEGERIREMLLEGFVAELGEIDGELLWKMMNRPGEGRLEHSQDWWKGFGRFERELVFALYGTAPSPPIEDELGDILVAEPVETPFDDSEAWLHYAEIVNAEVVLPFPGEEGRIPESVSLTARVVDDNAGLEMYREIGRYRYLVSQLPERLRLYFQE